MRLPFRHPGVRVGLSDSLRTHPQAVTRPDHPWTMRLAVKQLLVTVAENRSQSQESDLHDRL